MRLVVVVGRLWPLSSGLGRPRDGLDNGPFGGLRADGQLSCSLTCLGSYPLQTTVERVVAVLVEVQREVELGDEL